MAKQIFIDDNGNEVLLSGTINTADMLPVSASDQTSTADAIATLKEITTHKLSMGSLITSGIVNIVSANNRIVMTLMTDENNGLRIDFYGGNNYIRLQKTTDGSSWTTINQINFPAV